MLVIEHLTKSFGKKEVIHDISCNIEKGVYGLLGPNGSGKTTLLKCILGLYSYENGTIQLNGGDLSKGQSCKIGYLPQKSGVFPGLTVEEQLRYFAHVKKMNKDIIEATINEVLEKVNLTEQRKVAGSKLSGGMVRRVGVAQALMNHPDLLVFDEPTTGLDPEERMRFKNIIRSVGKECIVIMSTHIVEDVEAVCDKIIIMKSGCVEMIDTQENVGKVAEQKVYMLKKEEVTEADYVEKDLVVDGESYLRVLSSRKLDSEKQLKPSVEDGYLCVLKDI